MILPVRLDRTKARVYRFWCVTGTKQQGVPGRDLAQYLVAEGWGLTMCIILVEDTHLRTNIVIDDQLMKETLRATGLKTKREAVELGLRTLLRLSKQTEIRQLRGKLHWEGDLDAMRRDR